MVCWRVCAVWGSRQLVIVMALFWVLGSIGEFGSSGACASIVLLFLSVSPSPSRPGVFTAWSVMFVGLNYRHLPAPVETLVKHHTIVNTFAFSWSAATNVWATAMIAVKAWCVLFIRRLVWDATECNCRLSDRLQRRELKRHLGSSGLAVHDVLMLLVDFGVIYTIFMVRFSSVSVEALDRYSLTVPPTTLWQLLNVIVLIPSLNGGTFFSYVTMFMQQITVRSTSFPPVNLTQADTCTGHVSNCNHRPCGSPEIPSRSPVHFPAIHPLADG